METRPYSAVVYAGHACASVLCPALSRPCVRVTTVTQLFAEVARRPNAVAFIDADLLSRIDGEDLEVPVVAIIDEPPAGARSKTIRLLAAFPWLSHCLSSSLLKTPLARPHLAMFMDRLFDGSDQRILGNGGVGRVAKIAHAVRRETRFERMHQFFAKHGLSDRAIASIADVSEELVMNALYDAPAEAGYFKAAVPRTEDVELPDDYGCEISYGIEDGNVFVGLRDPFGAFTRERLLEVLNRCNADAVELDESRGGAGLGLWRIFSTATTIAITVIPGRLTEFVVRMTVQNGRLVKQLCAVDLFFAPEPSNDPIDRIKIPTGQDLFETSVTLVLSS